MAERTKPFFPTALRFRSFSRGPGLARRNIVQCADDPQDNRDLPDFVNGDGVAFPYRREDIIMVL
ncbi:MAG: hypothetical protein EOM65_12730 [Synergistales bacterium]|jgi:hypothetical protein|uniref:hypothetical protein n=1 Tax=Aminivibrio sp. TaxID=1872489 RepID=UPI001A402AF7|nr:hypothetical protein [Aminivibrio sp.]MBL3539345.1 hypothetical protein [Aminivibrio sp.]NCB17025.1 hypothetical protein [Synergistales bacterium]